MVSILIALLRGLFVWVGSWEIKKGPKRPRAHRLNLDGVQPSPAMRLGTTTISSFVIILRMRPTKLPKGCANHSGRGPKVKGNGREGYDFATLAGQAALGECEFAAVAQNAMPRANLRSPDEHKRHPGFSWQLSRVSLRSPGLRGLATG